MTLFVFGWKSSLSYFCLISTDFLKMSSQNYYYHVRHVATIIILLTYSIGAYFLLLLVLIPKLTASFWYACNPGGTLILYSNYLFIYLNGYSFINVFYSYLNIQFRGWHPSRTYLVYLHHNL